MVVVLMEAGMVWHMTAAVGSPTAAESTAAISWTGMMGWAAVV